MLKNLFSNKKQERVQFDGVRWSPEVVFKVYRNDDLKDLPLPILQDMKRHIDDIIEYRRRKVRKDVNR